MNSTANWPLFATTAPIDNTIDFIKSQTNFNKIMTQNNSEIELSLKANDLGSHYDKHRRQLQSPFCNRNNDNIGSNDDNNNSNNNIRSDSTNAQIFNHSIDESRDEELDDEDEDSMVGSIGDDDSLPSPDAMYATSYLSNDSNERNVIKDEKNKDDLGSDQSIGEHSPIGPLAQLQNALERQSAVLGMNLSAFSPTNAANHSVFGFGNNSMPSMGTPFNVDNDITGELYRCHLCSYSGTSKCQFNAHMNTHFDHKCPFCDYTSRTEGRLKRHVRDFHSDIPPDSWAGNRVLKENNVHDGDDSMDATDASVNGSGGNGKSRKYKCKQCQFVATCKQEFWDHSKEHIKSEKLLTCPKCNFVTEYKHHLEYHLRNHFGSKPFKCGKCNYSCVNKSMLNSHMKSHSNIYQYRCADCSYATKYCHSLKLHLRKYQHKPATVLNLDGTPNPYPVIDVYGTRRGPRPKKAKNQKNNEKSQQIDSSLPQTPGMPSSLSPNIMNSSTIPPLIPTSMPMPMGLPFMYPPNPGLIHSGLLGAQPMPSSLGMQLNPIPSTLFDSSFGNKSSDSHLSYNSNPKSQSQSPSHHKLRCNLCDFATETHEMLAKHLILHVGADNQEFCRIYGLNASAELVHQNAIIGELTARQSPDSRRLLEQMAVNPSLMNTILGIHSFVKPEHSFALELNSTPDSNTNEQNFHLSPQLVANDGVNSRPESAPIKPSGNDVELLLLPRSRSSPTDRFESLEKSKSESNSKQSISSETKPLDLSSAKTSSPLTQPFEPKISILTQRLNRSPLLPQILHPNDSQLNANAKMPTPVSSAQDVCIEQQQSRAQRRKGRASKLNVNRCLKMNDQSLKSDDLEEEMCEEMGDNSSHSEPDVDNIITKINSATNLLQEILIDMYSLKNDVYH